MKKKFFLFFLIIGVVWSAKIGLRSLSGIDPDPIPGGLIIPHMQMFK